MGIQKDQIKEDKIFEYQQCQEVGTKFQKNREIVLVGQCENRKMYISLDLRYRGTQLLQGKQEGIC